MKRFVRKPEGSKLIFPFRASNFALERYTQRNRKTLRVTNRPEISKFLPTALVYNLLSEQFIL